MDKSHKQGLLSAFICDFWWGIMPIYWHFLIPIKSSVIIFYRIFLVALICFVVAMVKYGPKKAFEPLKDKKLVLRYVFAGALITANWSLYIWAVNSGYVIQTCLGYYIEPLIMCAIGAIIFKEKLTKYSWTAIVFATVGVMAVVIYFKEFPFLALAIAITFCIYAVMKKNISIPPILSLMYETIMFAPIAIVVVIYLEVTGAGAIGNAPMYKFWLLLLCGLFTAFPLGLFANAANKINLFELGLIEYIGPTISLFIGIYMFNEPFEKIQVISFAIIWIGLAFFSYGEFKVAKETKQEVEKC